jgi:ribosome recycling factor
VCLNEASEYLEEEYFKIRTGRILPSFFDGIKVEAYGDLMPLNQVASIQILDARTTIIKPFDKSLLKDIASAINKSNLGVNPQQEIDHVKLNFPPITEETRQKNVKKCKELLEQAKLKIRKGREEIKNYLTKIKTEISEDDFFYFGDELDKSTKIFNTKLEEIFSKKQVELLKV